jgi:hypothetical protein
VLHSFRSNKLVCCIPLGVAISHRTLFWSTEFMFYVVPRVSYVVCSMLYRQSAMLLYVLCCTESQLCCMFYVVSTVSYVVCSMLYRQSAMLLYVLCCTDSQLCCCMFYAVPTVSSRNVVFIMHASENEQRQTKHVIMHE